MPLLAGIFTIVFAAWMMIAARNETVSAELASWHALLPIAGLVGVLAGSYVVGLIPAIALFLVVKSLGIKSVHLKSVNSRRWFLLKNPIYSRNAQFPIEFY